jgi:hypothetical protein
MSKLSKQNLSKNLPMFGILDFEHWKLFGAWDLAFGI